MLAVLVVLLAAGVFPLSLLAGQSLLSNASQVVTFLPVAAVGFLVARHQPRNPIGWLLLACATAPLLSADATLYVWLVYRLGHRLPLGPVAVLLAMTWTILFLTLPLVILLFPDGKLPSRRWRWVLWAYLAAVLCLVVSIYVAVVSTIVAHDVRIDASGGLTALDSPLGRTAWMSAVPVVIFPVLGAFWLSFVGRLVLSWRRTTAERRQQLKWLLSGSAISLVSGLIGNFIGVFDPHAPAAVQAVAAAESATMLSISGVPVPRMSWSTAHTDSRPRSSACRAAAAMSPGRSPGPADAGKKDPDVSGRGLSHA